MANEVKQFLRDHGIQEVEAIIPDMAGIARGKIMPAEKFAEDEGMRLPESIFLQTVTGDYPNETGGAMSPAEIDIVLKADPKTVLRTSSARSRARPLTADCKFVCSNARTYANAASDSATPPPTMITNTATLALGPDNDARTDAPSVGKSDLDMKLQYSPI